MSDLKTIVEQAMQALKTNANVVVQGQSKQLDEFYNIWKGQSSWMDYKYKLSNGKKVDAKLKTINAPRYFCRLWANNYANENTKVIMADDKSNDALQEVFAANNLFGRFNNFVEMFMGLGIGAMTTETTIMVDPETNEVKPKENAEIKIRMIPGRRVIPVTVEDGEVIECAFISYFTGGARLTIHYLDDKEEYHIAQFKATGNNGQYAFDYVNYTDIPTKAPKNTPLFQVWTPNLADEDEVDKNISTSIFGQALDAFKHLDLGYTAYYKEVKLGQKTKFISVDQISYEQDEAGNTYEVVPFDEEDESILFIKDANDAGSKMQEFNGELRIDAITKYINTNLNVAAMLCGLGQSQFEFDGGGGRPIQTATGVIAKQTELYRNVIKQENFATGNFQKLVLAIVHINNTFTNNPKMKVPKRTDITVTYDDNIVEDTASKKQAELNEVNAGVMSIAEYRSHWYDEDYDSALKFVQENGMLLDKYTLALQAHVITPEMFVDFVFGADSPYKKELVEYITQNQQQPQLGTGFEDESDQPKEKTEKQEQEPEQEEEDKDDE